MNAPIPRIAARVPGISWIRRHRLLTMLSVVALVILIVVYRNLTAEPSGIETTQVRRDTLVESVTANGTIQAREAADIKFNLPSKVTWVGIKRGDFVYRGQPLASLDARLLHKDLETALSDYMTTRWDFETARQDTYKDILLTDTIQRELDKSQFSLDRSVIAVEIASIAKKEAVLTSPVTGTVVSIGDLKPGLNLTGADINSMFVRVIDLNSFYFQSNVDEIDFSRISTGQAVEITLDAYPGVVCRGTVTYIAQEGEETGGGVITIPTEIDLVDCPVDLALGLNGQAQLITSTTQDTLVIPKQYLVVSGDQTNVWVQTGEQIKNRELRPVTTGGSTTDTVEITAGLAAGDTIIFIPES